MWQPLAWSHQLGQVAAENLQNNKAKRYADAKLSYGLWIMRIRRNETGLSQSDSSFSVVTMAAVRLCCLCLSQPYRAHLIALSSVLIDKESPLARTTPRTYTQEPQHAARTATPNSYSARELGPSEVMINEAVVRGVYAILSGQITRDGATGLITLYIIVFIIEIGKQIEYKLCYLSLSLEGIRGVAEKGDYFEWEEMANGCALFAFGTYPTAWRLRPAASACAVQCHSRAGRQSGKTPADDAGTSKRRVCCQLLLLLPPLRLLLLLPLLARWHCQHHRNLVVFAQMLALLLSLRTLVMPPPLQLNELNDNWPLLSLFLVCMCVYIYILLLSLTMVNYDKLTVNCVDVD